MVNVMTGGAVSNIMFFFYESAFTALPVAESGGLKDLV